MMIKTGVAVSFGFGRCHKKGDAPVVSVNSSLVAAPEMRFPREKGEEA